MALVLVREWQAGDSHIQSLQIFWAMLTFVLTFYTPRKLEAKTAHESPCNGQHAREYNFRLAYPFTLVSVQCSPDSSAE